MRLPGIGPRQASRFAYTMLDEDIDVLEGFGNALKNLETLVGRCKECFRGIEKKNKNSLCDTCAAERIQSILVVERDQDVETIAKTGMWHNGYHVLGGTVTIMNEKSRATERIRALYDRIKKRLEEHSPIEIVLATSATTEGDSTALYIERVLEPFVGKKSIILTRLGRGLSTGTELEFIDPETLKHALDSRQKG